MKKSIITSLLLIFCLNLSTAQKAIETQLRKYKNDDGAMSMSFSGDITQFFNGIEGEIKSSIEKCEVLFFKDGDINQVDKKKIDVALKADQYEMLVNVKNKQNRLKLYSIGDNDIFSKVYAQVNTPQMNLYFIFKGTIHFAELSKLAMDIEGGDLFKMLEGSIDDSSEK